MGHKLSFPAKLAWQRPGTRKLDEATLEQRQRSGVAGRRFRRNQHGVALIITLLMLLLLSGMAGAMLFSVNSDAMTNSYYGTFRASYYAADSGLNIARLAIYSQIQSAIPTTFSNTTQPIPAGTESTI